LIDTSKNNSRPVALQIHDESAVRETSTFKLPVLRTLDGAPAGAYPTILVDTREQEPLVFKRLPSIRATLVTADYSVLGLEPLFVVERKSLDDLANSCSGEGRQRFERELSRMRSYPFRRLLIIGSEDQIRQSQYHSKVNPQSVIGSLATWEIRFNLPVVFAASAEQAARQLESWAFYSVREIILNANRLHFTAPTPAPKNLK
jgi:ERCC4-type nuclease